MLWYSHIKLLLITRFLQWLDPSPKTRSRELTIEISAGGGVGVGGAGGDSIKKPIING